MMTYKFELHKDEVLQQLSRAVATALDVCGLLGEGYAMKICPVDTGHLRRSISYTVREDEQAAYIGTNVTYAPFVELGTRRQKAQPYLKPAVSDHTKQYKRIIEKAMKGEST